MFSFPPELLNTQSAVRFFSHADADLPRGAVLGWSRETLPSYSWRGLERPDTPCIFQYTLAGCGVLERGGTGYLLDSGKAFLVEVPDDHHYYLPEGWAPWEFVYLCFEGGDDVLRHVRWILAHHGPVLTLPSGHAALRCYEELFLAIHRQTMPDVETLAALLYRLVLHLRQAVDRPHTTPRPAIAQSLQFIARNYAREIGIDALAGEAGLSRAHFCRLFRREMGVSPLHYLTQVRLERAQALLRATPYTLEAIAQQCGFADASYFGKRFLQAFGMTPTVYRHPARVGK